MPGLVRPQRHRDIFGPPDPDKPAPPLGVWLVARTPAPGCPCAVEPVEHHTPGFRCGGDR